MAKKKAKAKPARKSSNKSAKKIVRKIATKKKSAKKKITSKKFVAPKKKGLYGLPEQLRDAALKVLDARQAEDIVTADMTGKSSMADYMIIASGRASRQLAAIAHYLREAFAKLGVHHLRVEGQTEGNWVLVDAGDIIVHLFRPEVRKYYDLEAIWNGSRKP